MSNERPTSAAAGTSGVAGAAGTTAASGAEPAQPEPVFSEPASSEPTVSKPVASEPVSSAPVSSAPVSSESPEGTEPTPPADPMAAGRDPRGEESAAEVIEEQQIEHAPVEVELRRSVRYGRIFVTTIVIGIFVGIIASLFFPVAEGADYELRQIAGLMAVVGGAIGLIVGALLSLFLGIIAGRKKGAAIAVQTDVR